MNRFTCDLHVHSCLSPCADDDNTPNNIAGMAQVSELNIVALTDHNTVKNCEAFFEASKVYGIVPIAGMELTTSEDIHVVCLFERLSDAQAFGDFVDEKRILIKNRKDIFGNQLILDGADNLIGEEEFLLSNATSLSIEDVPSTVSRFGGICYPAHIDRDSNGIIAILGTVPKTPFFGIYELRDEEKKETLIEKHNLYHKMAVVSSDAHNLENIGENGFSLMLDAEYGDTDGIRKKLFELLRVYYEGNFTQYS